MADERIRQPVKITDPLTDANEAGVDASGNLQVIVNAALPTGGNNIGDVDILSIIPGVAPTNLGKAESATHVTGDTGVGVWGVRNDAETALALDGEYIPFMMSSVGRLLVETQGGAGGTSETDSDPFTVASTAYVPVGGIFDDVSPGDLTEGDGGAVRMSAVREMYTNIRDGAGGERSANVTAAFELNVFSTVQPGVDIGDVTVADFGAALTDADDDVVAFASTSLRTINLLYASDGVQWERLTSDGSGSLDVNVTLALPTGGNTIGNVGFDAGETEGDDDSIAFAQTSLRSINLLYGSNGSEWERLTTDGSGALDVNVVAGGGESVPDTPVLVADTETNTAAGAIFNVDTATLDGLTRTIRGFTASASVPIKASLVQVDNNIETIHVTLFARAGEAIIYRAPHRDYHQITFGSTGGFDGFRIAITNLDNTQAADTHGTLFLEN